MERVLHRNHALRNGKFKATGPELYDRGEGKTRVRTNEPIFANISSPVDFRKKYGKYRKLLLKR